MFKIDTHNIRSKNVAKLDKSITLSSNVQVTFHSNLEQTSEMNIKYNSKKIEHEDTKGFQKPKVIPKMDWWQKYKYKPNEELDLNNTEM